MRTAHDLLHNTHTTSNSNSRLAIVCSPCPILRNAPHPENAATRKAHHQPPNCHAPPAEYKTNFPASIPSAFHPRKQQQRALKPPAQHVPLRKTASPAQEQHAATTSIPVHNSPVQSSIRQCE